MYRYFNRKQTSPTWLDWVFETGEEEEESDCWLIFIDIIVSLRPSVYMLVLEGETRNQNNMCIDREH